MKLRKLIFHLFHIWWLTFYYFAFSPSNLCLLQCALPMISLALCLFTVCFDGNFINSSLFNYNLHSLHTPICVSVCVCVCACVCLCAFDIFNCLSGPTNPGTNNEWPIFKHIQTYFQFTTNARFALISQIVLPRNSF